MTLVKGCEKLACRFAIGVKVILEEFKLKTVTQNINIHYLNGLFTIQSIILISVFPPQNVTSLDFFHLDEGCLGLSVICSVN